ncbi:hypothetical protein GCM10023116_47960 [Kistimonas scapharcae]|uniref:DUF1902 domain-containing protein n=1 Tax=Kistimonas scapharcae TaxID=1036133 RepID=A0ABP8V9D4_9GAMM
MNHYLVVGRLEFHENEVFFIEAESHRKAVQDFLGIMRDIFKDELNEDGGSVIHIDLVIAVQDDNAILVREESFNIAP